MSAASTFPAAGLSDRPKTSGWIISKRDDLIWFIGSAAVSYMALALMAAGFPILPLQYIWFFGVDGPHVYSTITRTYLDRAERAKLGRFLWMPLPLVLIGPLMTWAGLYSLFTLLAVCWQHYHIVKQHFGMVMLYKAKARDRDRNDFWLDRIFLLASLFAPLAIFVLRTQPGIRALVEWLPAAVFTAYGLIAGAWVLRQIQKMRAGIGIHWQKTGLLFAVVPLQWLALLHASQFGPDGILRAGITLGLFHSFQYHRLMWFHNKNRYTEPGAAETHGFAARLVSSVWIYAAVAIGLHFVGAFVPQLLFPLNKFVSAAMWGFAFTHYCLDARIWHVRSDKGLARALKMA